MNSVQIIDGPNNWEVLQQKDGVASFEVSGFFDNIEDNTGMGYEILFDHVYVRVVNEETGAHITGLIPVTVKDNSFSVEIKNLPCGGPYMIDMLVFEADKRMEFPIRGEPRRHFYVGDVFLIAGQSNAAGMGKGFVREALEPGISMLRNLEYWDVASNPMNDFDYAKNSMFITFAKTLKKEISVPIGLIPAAIGGASLSRWLKNENGDLYRQTLDAINKTSGIKAVLWYQGCADAGECCSTENYIERFKIFINDLRSDVKKQDLAIFTFQLNRQKMFVQDAKHDLHYDLIREAQRQLAKGKDIFVLPAIDATNMTDFIHSSSASNSMLGQRLAMQVANKLYGKGNGANAPEISGAFISKDKKCITVEFDHVLGYLYDFNVNLEDFPIEVQDQNGGVALASYELKGNKIVLRYDKELLLPVSVSGQTGTNPKNIIIDFTTQIPILCFKNYSVTEET